MTSVTPTARATAWLSCLGDALAASDIGAAVTLFGSECYWRDLLTFTWNIKTMEGHEAILRMLEATLTAITPSAWTIVEDATETDGVVEAWFTFETRVARGKGHLRLRGDKGWTFLTTMTELQGHEERRGVTRENGVAHGASRDRLSWLERKSTHQAALGRAGAALLRHHRRRSGRHRAWRSAQAPRRSRHHPREERAARRFLALPL